MSKWIYFLLITLIGINQNISAKDSKRTCRMLTHKSFYYENPYVLYDYQIEKLSIRGLDAYLSLMPGITFQDGIMHIRGGLNNTTQFLLNSADITSPYNYAREVYIIPEAIQTLSLSKNNTLANNSDAFIIAHTDPDYRNSVGNHLTDEYYPSLEDINPFYFNRYLGSVYVYDRFGNEDDDAFLSDPEEYGSFYNAYGGQQYLNMYKAINIKNG